MNPLLVRVARAAHAFRRPSKAGNLKRLRRRGETPAALGIREATSLDVAAIAKLHVVTWRATHGFGSRGPGYEVRLSQWQAKFASDDPDWFCFVAHDRSGVLVGFANGHRYAHPEPAGFSGQLEKVYLLSAYQRLGLGRRLVCHAARRLLSRGIPSMLLFCQPDNPSCDFFEAMGGERLLSASGAFHGAYGWRELDALAAACSEV